MTCVYIQKNISQALDYLKDKDLSKVDCYFIKDPTAKGERSKREESDFQFLRCHIQNIKSFNMQKIPANLSDESIFFGWDTINEKKYSSSLSATIGPQNRLLDSFDFNNIKSFTPFRKIMETSLPINFTTNNYQHQDSEVQKELHYYFRENHLAKSYFESRNGVLGRDYSTKLSGYLASGRLNVRYLYNYIKDYESEFGSNKSTYWIIFELIWREFFYWSYQRHKSRYFSKNGILGELDFKLNIDAIDYKSLFEHDPFMLAVSCELINTGFISNRFRQVFASSLINEYELDWRIGAQFFEHYLIDYDVYSNWGNWQYQAGVGHDPRGKRRFNILKQLGSYDPEYKYIKLWTDHKDSQLIESKLQKIYTIN